MHCSTMPSGHDRLKPSETVSQNKYLWSYLARVRYCSVQCQVLADLGLKTRVPQVVTYCYQNLCYYLLLRDGNILPRFSFLHV